MGHSTLGRGELAALLRDHSIRTVADVRRHPGSRRHPHVAAEALASWLPEAGIAYVHLAALGGRRRPVPGSPNGGWENASFQGYADWMGDPSFAAALEEVEALDEPAIMCAEAQWWRCHRRLIADALLVRGHDVRHIIGSSDDPHELTPSAGRS